MVEGKENTGVRYRKVEKSENFGSWPIGERFILRDNETLSTPYKLDGSICGRENCAVQHENGTGKNTHSRPVLFANMRRIYIEIQYGDKIYIPLLIS